jgi:ATP-binding cassette subfamily B protein
MGGGGGFGNSGVPGVQFSGIPPEMQPRVEKLLEQEPAHDDPTVVYTARPSAQERRTLSIWGLLRQYPGLLAWAIVLTCIIAFTMQMGPVLTGWAVDDGMAKHDFSVVVVLSIVYLLSVGITGLSQRAQVRATGRLASWVMHDLRIKVFTHLQRLSLDYFTEEKAGVVMTRMTSDIENLQQLLQDGLAQFATQALTMVVITTWLFAINVRLALITVVLILPALTAMTLWFRKVSEQGYSKVRDGIANVLAHLAESLHGVRVVTAHNRQQRNVVEHREVLGRYRDANDYTARANAYYGPSTQLLGWIGQAVLLLVGGNMVLHHELLPGQLITFFLFLNRFFNPIQLLVQQYNSFQQSNASILKLRELFATTPSVDEAVGATELPPIEGQITFDHVSFGYRAGVEVLSDVDLTIAAGETVAFVGPTGAGKSTMAKLVTRFYDPTRGRVLIDGHDLRAVTLHSLRHQLGVVPQEPFLFAGTIRDNIAFADPEASDQAVAEAVDAVGLRDLVDRLPEGVDTVVHERGQSLSSGERQLIALARAFLAHPRVLVLDEATSNLDLKSETTIESALDVLLAGRTAVLIAHRLSTAMRADRIVVVDDGRVVEVGSHDELVALGGRYAAMYETWVSHSQVA